MPAFIGHDFNIVECLDLEQAVATARKLNRYEFLVTFAPFNPLAIF